MEDAKPASVSDTLAERGNRYGDFMGHAQVTQDLKNCVAEHLAARAKKLAPDQQEALDMIFHKIGRIINGDPDYADSWHDIAGYAQLVDDWLKSNDDWRKPRIVSSSQAEGSISRKCAAKVIAKFKDDRELRRYVGL
jgi:hypothetical protein